jgi:hypothetical protein
VRRRRRRGGGDAAAAPGESLGTLVLKLRMDGGEMYAPNFAPKEFAARAPNAAKASSLKVGPRSRGGLGRFGRAWLNSDGDGTLCGCGFGRFCARAASSMPARPRAAAAARLRRRGPRRLHESAVRVRAGHGGYYAG